MKYFDNLVCPYTKQKLYYNGQSLLSKDGKICFPVIDGIPCFIKKDEIETWNNYHEIIYSQLPTPPHPYYKQFAEDWDVMLDLGCGDGAMSAGAAYKVKEIYCCDPSLRALKVLQKRGIKNMYPILAKGEYLPFCDNFLMVFLVYLLLNI